jgi:hypothetical protein
MQRERDFVTEWWNWGAATLGAALVTALFLSPQSPCHRAGPVKPPRTVLIIRHAEKPPDYEMSQHLSPRGGDRARELHRLFESWDGRYEPLPKPDFIFAASASKHSHRPHETLAPLAKALDLWVQGEFAKEDCDGLANELLRNPKYTGTTVLVCWHHGTLPQLVRALGVSDLPDDWRGTAFDRVWRIDYDDAGKAALSSAPQHLLPGDRKK